MTTKEVAKICGVTERTVYNNANKANVILEHGKAKDWTEDELKRLQLVLMKNASNAGGQHTDGSVVKSTVESTFKSGLTFQEIVNSGNIEAAEQFRAGDQLISSIYKSEPSTKLTVLENEVTLMGKIFNVYGTVEEPLFRAKDVADWLDVSNVSQMVQSVDEDEKGIYNVYTLGGNQDVFFLTENGVYEVLMLSRKPIAKEFKKEVKKMLHTLRTKKATLMPTNFADALEAYAKEVRAREEAQQALFAETQQNKLLLEQKEKAEAETARIYQYNKNFHSNLYTASDIAKKFGITPNMVGRIANENGLKQDPIYGKLGKIQLNNGKWVNQFYYNEDALTVIKSMVRKCANIIK